MNILSSFVSEGVMESIVQGFWVFVVAMGVILVMGAYFWFKLGTRKFVTYGLIVILGAYVIIKILPIESMGRTIDGCSSFIARQVEEIRG